MNIIAMFEDLFDVGYLLFCCKVHFRPLHHSLMPRDPRDILLICLIADQITNKHCLVCCSSVFKHIID